MYQYNGLWDRFTVVVAIELSIAIAHSRIMNWTDGIHDDLALNDRMKFTLFENTLKHYLLRSKINGS